MGLFKFTVPAWDVVEKFLGTLDDVTRDRLDVTGLLRRLLADASLPIGTFATDGQWGEIDNPQDVALYEKMVSEGELLLEDALPAGEPTIG